MTSLTDINPLTHVWAPIASSEKRRRVQTPVKGCQSPSGLRASRSSVSKTQIRSCILYDDLEQSKHVNDQSLLANSTLHVRIHTTQGVMLLLTVLP